MVVLKDAFDFSFEEIAGASGMPVGTAKCYAHRARNGLRERLSRMNAAPGQGARSRRSCRTATRSSCSTR